MKNNYYSQKVYKQYWKRKRLKRKVLDCVKILLLSIILLCLIKYISNIGKVQQKPDLKQPAIHITYEPTYTEQISEHTYKTITKDNVYSFNLREPSKLNEFVLETYLEKFPNLKGLAKPIMEVQEKYNVNGVFLLAIIHLESGNGTSSLAKSHNNLGGIKSGTSYRGFETKSACIDYMGRLLSKYYLSENGQYFNGYTISDVNKRYCELNSWTDKVANLMLQVQEGLNNYVY